MKPKRGRVSAGKWLRNVSFVALGERASSLVAFALEVPACWGEGDDHCMDLIRLDLVPLAQAGRHCALAGAVVVLGQGEGHNLEVGHHRNQVPWNLRDRREGEDLQGRSHGEGEDPLGNLEEDLLGNQVEEDLLGNLEEGDLPENREEEGLLGNLEEAATLEEEASVAEVDLVGHLDLVGRLAQGLVGGAGSDWVPCQVQAVVADWILVQGHGGKRAPVPQILTMHLSQVVVEEGSFRQL